MRYINVGSGSSGNSTIIYNKNTTLIIDCGVSKKRITDCLKSISKNLDDVSAMLITHLHKDHTASLEMLSKDLCEKTYGGEKEILNQDMLDKLLLHPFENFVINTFSIIALPTSHDTPHPLGYVIKDLENNTTLLYMTDTGYVPMKDIKYASNLTYYILESNHDPEMLMKSDRNNWLKKRIISMKGHLSNEQSSNSLANMIGPNTKEVALAHLSHECNTKELAISMFEKTMRERLSYVPNITLKVLDPKEVTSGGDISLD